MLDRPPCCVSASKISFEAVWQGILACSASSFERLGQEMHASVAGSVMFEV